jgi:hypothetical protein
MQIRQIILYSLNGAIQPIDFSLNATNIITGRKGTGKSALIRIIEYCLGSGECRVPEGRIRDSVSWYGLMLSFDDSELFIARAEPGPGRRSSTKIFVDRGSRLEAPPMDELAQNISTDDLVDLLTDRLGIATVKTKRPATSTQTPYDVSSVHAQFFTFLRQDEIAKPNQLFHRQDEEFVAGHIRDVLPYFLGAITEDRITVEQRLRNDRSILRRLERELEQLGDTGASEPQAAALVQEAISVGLLRAARVTGSPVALLRELDIDAEPVLLVDEAEDEVGRLHRERDRLLREQREIRDRLDTLRALLQEETGYTGELDAQRARLKAVDLFSNDSSAAHCPVCNQDVHEFVQPVTAIVDSIARLNARLATMTASVPRIERSIASLEDQANRLREQLRDNQVTLNQFTSQVQRLREERDAFIGSAITRGRIDLFLETFARAEDQTGALSERIAALRKSVEQLEQELSFENVAERLESMLVFVGDDLSRYASRLDLEHQRHVRLDIRNLTVVADTETGPVPMERMGSGANWVGYHLAAYAALHRWFERKRRPVPRFIFFDQPTQAFYPADADEPDLRDDDDRRRVDEMFRFLLDLPSELGNRVQVIVTDHATLRIPGFREAVRESWHTGGALIPAEWPRRGVAGESS